jgi:hypothetical protein
VQPDLSIEPNSGLGPLLFGVSPEEARIHLGAPDTTDEHAGPAPELGFGWGYNRLHLDVFFHTPGLFGGSWNPKGPMQLVMFTCGNTGLTLWGERIVGLNETEVMAILRRFGEHVLEMIPPKAYPIHVRSQIVIIRVLDLNLDLHFGAGRLQSCQWRWVQETVKP